MFHGCTYFRRLTSVDLHQHQAPTHPHQRNRDAETRLSVGQWVAFLIVDERTLGVREMLAIAGLQVSLFHRFLAIGTSVDLCVTRTQEGECDSLIGFDGLQQQWISRRIPLQPCYLPTNLDESRTLTLSRYVCYIGGSYGVSPWPQRPYHPFQVGRSISQ